MDARSCAAQWNTHLGRATPMFGDGEPSSRRSRRRQAAASRRSPQRYADTMDVRASFLSVTGLGEGLSLDAVRSR